MVITIYNMDVRKALKQLPDESVDMQICSPPYWGLRDYGEGTEEIWDGDENCEHDFELNERRLHGGTTKSDIPLKSGQETDWKTKDGFCQKCGAWKGQLGLEPDFNLFIKHLADVFDEVKRVLNKDGTCWINLGDTYFGSGTFDPSHKGVGEGLESNKQNNLVFPQKDKKPKWKEMDLKPKCLVGVPERFMIEMMNRGWILRNKIIWHKPNHMPTSVKDRFANSWEYLFLFVKQKKYYFDLDAVREPHKEISIKRFFAQDHLEKRKKDPTGMISLSPEIQIKSNIKQRQKYLNSELKGKNPDDVIQTHYAVAERQKEIIEYRNLPDIKEFSDYINTMRKERGLSIERVEDIFGNRAPHHWFNAESFPSKEDYQKLKDLLYLDDRYDNQMIEIFIKPAEKQNHPLGKNPSDTWKDHIRDDERSKKAREQNMITFYSHSRRFPPKFKHADDVIDFGKYKDKETEQRHRQGFDKQRIMDSGGSYGVCHPLGKNPSDFWDITTQPYPESHFAVFPEKLVEKPIKTTRKNATILDIFAGSGTTLKVARDLNRNSIGIEIKKEYCDLIFKRLYKGNVPLTNEFKLIRW